MTSSDAAWHAGVDSKRSRLDLGDIQQIVDEPRHPLRGPDNRLDKSTRASSDTMDCCSLVAPRADGIERTSQIVRDGPQHLVARNRGLLRVAVESRVVQRARRAPSELFDESKGLSIMRDSSLQT